MVTSRVRASNLGPPATEPRARRDERPGNETRVASASPSASASAPGTAAATSTPASAASDETSQVRRALAELRGAKDAAAALRALDEYQRRFPAGQLSEEARLIRIEALLSLGQSAEALQSLETLPASSLERSRRLRVARGELRAAQGRCDEALQDFAAILTLATTTDDDVRHRAQRGRDACAAAAPKPRGARE